MVAFSTVPDSRSAALMAPPDDTPAKMPADGTSSSDVAAWHRSASTACPDTGTWSHLLHKAPATLN
jgi:hypothetical protein